MKICIAAAAACLVAAAYSTSARADALADACADFAKNSPITQSMPGDKPKWCGCIQSKIAPAQRDKVAPMMTANKQAELKGEMYPLDLSTPAGNQYYEALSACLPILMATGEPSSGGGSPSPAAAAAPVSAKGIHAWHLAVGNSITGQIDGRDFVDFYLEDGTVKTLHGRNPFAGVWTFEQGNVCFAYPKVDKDCYAVAVEGNAITFIDKNGRKVSMTLVQGNPKKL